MPRLIWMVQFSLSAAAVPRRDFLPAMTDEISPQAEPLPDDVALMARVKTGDTRAFEQLIETHQVRVIGTVAKMLGDDTDAEDIAQQVFIRVWKSAGRYEPTAKFTTWLFKI